MRTVTKIAFNKGLFRFKVDYTEDGTKRSIASLTSMSSEATMAKAILGQRVINFLDIVPSWNMDISEINFSKCRIAFAVEFEKEKTGFLNICFKASKEPTVSEVEILQQFTTVQNKIESFLNEYCGRSAAGE